MAKQLLFSTSSHSSLLLHLPKPHNPRFSLHFSPIPQSLSLLLPSTPITFSATQRSNLSRTVPSHPTLRVASKTPPDILTVGLESEGVTVSVEPDTAGGSGGGRFEDLGGGGGGGGGGGDNSGGGGGEGEEESDKDKKKKKMALSMSQKLTLGYAALVGVGGVMGYVKSGSQKSLLAGGVSSGLLYYVYTQLPSNPTFASSVGLGVSAALLAVMGSRFKKSGKIFPAGVVSLVSLIMTGGYLHGILLTAH